LFIKLPIYSDMFGKSKCVVSCQIYVNSVDSKYERNHIFLQSYSDTVWGSRVLSSAGCSFITPLSRLTSISPASSAGHKSISLISQEDENMHMHDGPARCNASRVGCAPQLQFLIMQTTIRLLEDRFTITAKKQAFPREDYL
jgi:hypothetical protein